MSYIKPEAKEEQKKRMEEQVGVVREKMKNWADRVVVGGFEQKQIVEHHEGDVWEEGGKKWTIKNGIKQTIRKTQTAVTPWWCPKCGRSLDHWIHEKFYKLRGACHDCVVKYEGKMRLDGVWEAYERRTIRNNEKAWIHDTSQAHTDYIKTFRTPQLHFQDGRWEELAAKSLFEERFEELRKDIDILNQRLKQLEKEEAEDADEQSKLTEWERNNPWS